MPEFTQPLSDFPVSVPFASVKKALEEILQLESGKIHCIREVRIGPQWIEVTQLRPGTSGEIVTQVRVQAASTGRTRDRGEGEGESK